MIRLLPALLLAACGTFEPVAEYGAATAQVCLRRPNGEPAIRLPTFVVVDRRPYAESRTDERGCVVIEAPVGRSLLVAHDFRGLGLVEPLRLYAGQQLRVERVISPLALNPLVPELRGVGTGERLAVAAPIGGALRCLNERAISIITTEQALRVDAYSGAVDAGEGILSLRPHSAPWLGFALEVQGTSVQPEGTGWRALEAAESAFTGFTIDGAANGALGGQWYGSAHGVWRLNERCQLLSNGRCVSAASDGGTFVVTIHTPEEGPRQTVHALDARPFAMVPTLAGTRLTLFTEDDAGVGVWRIGPEGARSLAHIPGVRRRPAEWSPGAADQPTLVVVDASERMQWIRADPELDEVTIVDLPRLSPAALLQPRADRSPSVRIGVERVDPDTWRVTIFEHRGGSLRARSLDVPLGPLQAWSELGRDVADRLHFPGIDFLPAGPAGVEILRVGRELRLLAEGAPLREGRPMATLGTAVSPACLAGSSLMVFADPADPTAYETGSAHVVRYDISRIAHELAITP